MSTDEMERLTDISTARYREFAIPKRNGKFRQIRAPCPRLMSIQKRIGLAIECCVSISDIACAYAVGRSIFDHALPHVGKKWAVVVDLEDFFGSISSKRVSELMRDKLGLVSEVADAIAEIVCLDGSLPQGAPTSPIISNLACDDLDRELLFLASAHECSVSRYADDICISGSSDSPPNEIVSSGRPRSVGFEFRKIFERHGFVVNEYKFKFFAENERKLITGLVVSDFISMPRAWRRQLRTLRYLLKARPENEVRDIIASWTSTSFRARRPGSLLDLIDGKQAFANWLDAKNSQHNLRSPK